MFIPEDPGRRRKRAYSGFWRINGAWSSRLTPPKIYIPWLQSRLPSSRQAKFLDTLSYNNGGCAVDP
jgi:hypothetical protein